MQFICVFAFVRKINFLYGKKARTLTFKFILYSKYRIPV